MQQKIYSFFSLGETQAEKAFILSKIFRAPFWVIFNMLPFILYKNLGASPVILAFLITLKPVVSLFSVYWGAFLNKRPDRLKSNLLWALFLGPLPFLFSPWLENVYLFVLFFGMHMLLHRGVMPAWMEVLRQNIPTGKRETVFVKGNAWGYVGDVFLPLALGYWLDSSLEAWRYAFFFSALLSFISLFFVFKIPFKNIPKKNSLSFFSEKPFIERLKEPWQNAYQLLKRRKDFSLFQLGFMLGGSGLMIIQATLPVFFVDQLHLSYTELLLALSLFKGLGLLTATPFLNRVFSYLDIYSFSGCVTLLAIFWPIGIFFASTYFPAIFIAYFLYGMMQAGSEVAWNLSGPAFSKKEDSTLYSTVNLLTVGLRGCVAPYLGSILTLYFGSAFSLMIGAIFCGLATIEMFYARMLILPQAKAYLKEPLQ